MHKSNRIVMVNEKITTFRNWMLRYTVIFVIFDSRYKCNFDAVTIA